MRCQAADGEIPPRSRLQLRPQPEQDLDERRTEKSRMGQIEDHEWRISLIGDFHQCPAQSAVEHMLVNDMKGGTQSDDRDTAIDDHFRGQSWY